MAKRRNFTPEFKAEVVLKALRGQSSQAELCRRHNLSEEQFSKWICSSAHRVFIIQVYHRKRPHSALGYLTLIKCKQQGLSELY